MTEKDLKRLVKQGAIVSYEVLEVDADGTVLDMRIRAFPVLPHFELKEVKPLPYFTSHPRGEW